MFVVFLGGFFKDVLFYIGVEVLEVDVFMDDFCGCVFGYV